MKLKTGSRSSPARARISAAASPRAYPLKALSSSLSTPMRPMPRTAPPISRKQAAERLASPAMSPIENQVKGTIDAALAAFGRIDVLVNNAVFYNKKGVIDMTFEEWNRQTAVILGGAFLFTKYACRAMISKQGRQRHQYRLDRRASGRAQQHRLFDRQVRRAELHPLGGHGACRTRHPRQQPDADRDRSSQSFDALPVGAVRSGSRKASIAS